MAKAIKKSERVPEIAPVSLGELVQTQIRGAMKSGRAMAAHRTDKRCDLGSLTARPGWGKFGLPRGSPA